MSAARRPPSADSKSMLDAFQASIMAMPDIHGRSKSAAVEAVALLWDYLDRTPGEQLPCASFGEMLGMNGPSAYGRLSALEKLGLVTKTASRKGSGGGVGFVCPWLEARRRSPSPGGPAPAAAEPKARGRQAGTKASDHDGMLDPLERIDAAADRGVAAARGLAPSDATLTITQALREIQALVATERRMRLKGTA